MDKIAVKQRLRGAYADTYETMKWLSPEEADRARDHRRTLLDRIGPSLNWSFSDTKPHTGPLSPGCRLCGQGTWSCLFINNICNARCFYCPSAQNEIGIPGTNTLDFKNPEEYADYVRTFDIQGVSFSGGEPMMSYEQVLKFLSILRKRVQRPLHIWMYTNGILITRDKLKALADSGLDEIRYDISANHYLLEKVALAVNVVPTVTVEIPAIPEDMGRLKATVAQLDSLGANHLNLHQIRCTDFNKTRLIQRGYTFVHGPKATVLETELAALELIAHAQETGIRLPVNYCSFTFRHQYQAAGIRRRNAALIRTGVEDITENGHLRTLALVGEPASVQAIDSLLTGKGTDRSLWQCPKPGTRLVFNPSLLGSFPLEGMKLCLSYHTTSLKPGVSYRNPFTEIRLNSRRSVFIEKRTELRDACLEGTAVQSFADRFVRGSRGPSPALTPGAPEFPEEILTYETFQRGLAEYF